GRLQRVQDLELRNFHGGRHEIFGKRARQKAAVVGIRKLFQQGGSECGGERAVDLTVSQAGIEDGPAIVARNVFVDADLPGVAVDLYAAKIETEAVSERRVDLVVCGGRREVGGAPGHAFARRRRHSLRQGGGRTVRLPRGAGGVKGVVR